MTTQKSLELRGMKFVRNRDTGLLIFRVSGESAAELQAELIADVARRVELFVHCISETKIETQEDRDRGWTRYKIASDAAEMYGRCYHCGETILNSRSGPCALCESAMAKAMARIKT